MKISPNGNKIPKITNIGMQRIYCLHLIKLLKYNQFFVEAASQLTVKSFKILLY